MKFKQKIMSTILAGVLFTSSIFVSNANTKTQQLEVHFINVGQGDSTYIELPDGTDILIDTGISSKGNIVVDYLKSQEKDIDIEYLIATHPDADHVGGMQEVFKQLNVKNFYYPMDTQSNTQTWKNVLELAKKEGCSINNTFTGISFEHGDATVMFVQPSKDYSDNNEDSVVTLVDYNNTEILLTGDAEEQTEKDMISEGLLQDVDVLKVGHHGSNSSTTQEFLNTIKPEHAVISVGANNSYGHPTSNVLNKLSSACSKVWRTDINGNVVLSTNGNTYTIKDSTGNIFDSQDTSKTEWKYIGGNWYYYVNGTKKTGWINDAGTWYYLNANGAMATGWKQIGNTWYYLKSNGAMATGWEKVNGTWYYLNANGAMATGWKQIGNTWYYLKSSGAMATGWEQVGSKWYYMSSSGVMQKGWLQLGSKWYYLNSSGAMVTGWLDLNNKWYYLEPSGVMATGWKQISGNWYYFYGSGVMASNTVIDGWQINSSGIGKPVSNSGGSNGNGSINISTVYVTPGGKSYHSTRSCTALKRSTTILSMTLKEAINKGKSDPCNLCVR